MKKLILIAVILFAPPLYAGLQAQDMNMPNAQRSNYIKKDGDKRVSKAGHQGNASTSEPRGGLSAIYAEIRVQNKNDQRKFSLDLGNEKSHSSLNKNDRKLLESTMIMFTKMNRHKSGSLVAILNAMNKEGWTVLDTFNGMGEDAHILLVHPAR